MPEIHQTRLQNRKYERIVLYLFFCYLIDLYLCSAYLNFLNLVDFRTFCFVIAVLLTYPVLYLLPVLILYPGLKYFGQNPAAGRLINFAIIALSTSITLLLYADTRLYDLYGFHINAFAINIITTPGGIDSLGGSQESFIDICIIMSGICCIHLLAYWWSGRADIRFGSFLIAKRVLIFSLVVFLGITERLIYGVSDIQLHAAVIKSSNAFPMYQRVRFRSLFRMAGFEVHNRKGIKLGTSNLALNYPLAKIKVKPPEKPLNLVWLVAESLRWDMLTPEIMPHTWELSQRSLNLQNHYSGGNGTRQGLFALFYGIYGSYWDAFLVEEKGPVILDVLQQQNYQMSMYTSASFTYPEFDKTIFAQTSPRQLHQFGKELTVVEKDDENVSRLLAFIEKKKQGTPFFTFMFFESTHARYYFPEHDVIRSPYLADLNYATMSRESLWKDMGQLKNRYVNASHYLDRQFNRVISYLERTGLLENTILLITGDHGEEFMEKGHWGHNAGFSEEQIRSPMVIYIPGVQGREITTISSHMDIVPTLLPLLGVANPVADYSLGDSLLNGDRQSSAIVSDWAGLAYIDDQRKFTIPFKDTFAANNLSTRDDVSIASSVDFLNLRHDALLRVLNNSRKFLKQR